MCPEADNDLATLGSNTWRTLISIIINFGVRVHQTALSSIYLFLPTTRTLQLLPQHESRHQQQHNYQHIKNLEQAVVLGTLLSTAQ